MVALNVPTSQPETSSNKVSETMEKYCEAIYYLSVVEPVKLVNLARRMGVAGSTVFATLHRMQKSDLITVSQHPYRVNLTPAGEEVALKLVRRHNLLEKFLVNHLGLSQDEVQVEAERLKYAISNEVEEALNRFLV